MYRKIPILDKITSSSKSKHAMHQVAKPELQVVEKLVDKPVIQCVERIVEVPQVTVQECIVEVPEPEARSPFALAFARLRAKCNFSVF